MSTSGSEPPSRQSIAGARQEVLVLLAAILIGLAIGTVYFFGIPRRESPSTAAPQGIAGGSTPSSAAPAPVVGAPAPDFQLESLSGRRIRLNDLKGQVVLLNFWATWCAPCRIEMPALQARHLALADDGLVVLGVNFDETRSQVHGFRDELGLTFELLLDPGGVVQRLYGILGYPTSFFVDREGIIRVEHIGLMTEEQLDDYLREVGLQP